MVFCVYFVVSGCQLKEHSTIGTRSENQSTHEQQTSSHLEAPTGTTDRWASLPLHQQRSGYNPLLWVLTSCLTSSFSRCVASPLHGSCFYRYLNSIRLHVWLIWVFLFVFLFQARHEKVPPSLAYLAFFVSLFLRGRRHFCVRDAIVGLNSCSHIAYHSKKLFSFLSFFTEFRGRGCFRNLRFCDVKTHRVDIFYTSFVLVFWAF